MFMFISKLWPESFTFLIQRNLELLRLKFVFFSKSTLLFNIFYCFCKFVNNILQTLQVDNSIILQIKKFVKFSGYYFCTNTDKYGKLQVCISVPLQQSFRKSYMSRKCPFIGLSVWNSQLTFLKQSNSLNIFKHSFKEYQ